MDGSPGKNGKDRIQKKLFTAIWKEEEVERGHKNNDWMTWRTSERERRKGK